MDDEQSAQRIQDLLHAEGYKAQIEDDHSVGSAAAGLKFQVLPYRRSIQFRCGIKVEDKSGVDLGFTNDMNGSFRFLKVYLDDDGDLIMEADWLINLSEVEKETKFKDALDLWELSLASLSERMRAVRREAAA